MEAVIKMDDKGYAFTPLSLLMIIPVVVIAIAYGNIINEASLIGSLITGGDVTYTSATTIITSMQKGAADAGRNSAYNASRQVVDDKAFYASGTSKNAIRNNIIAALNSHIVNTTIEVSRQSGRDIYINNILIDSYNDTPFTTSNVNITQTDPYGFYVNIKGGLPIKIVQKDRDQVYELRTPDISTYVSIEGLEDPYIWIYTKYRSSNVIYNYPYYAYSSVYGPDFQFDVDVDKVNNRIYHLWDCLNGTNNPSTITPRPFYFPDPSGLSFFDRLEGKNTSTEAGGVRMSTFIIGDPLLEDHGRSDISKVDREYFTAVIGTYTVKFGNDEMTDPLGSIFYLSNAYKTYFNLANSY